MQSARRGLCVSADDQLLYLGAKIVVFTALCGFVVGEAGTQYHGNPDGIVFPGPVDSGSSTDRNFRDQRSAVKTGNGDDNDVLIPVNLAAKLNSIESSGEFLELLQDVPTTEKKFILNSRFGEGEERSNAEIPRPAKCIPELQTVSLKMDNDPSTIIYPSCTRINRCGGCCSTSLLSCQPITVEIRNFEVLVATVNGLDYKGRRIVPLEEHTKCRCDCRVKKEHCNEKQHYEPDECKCVCNNVDEAEKCKRSNETKLWDPELCICVCRNVADCNTGFYFDHNTCRCRQISLSRQMGMFGSAKGSNYDFANARKPANVPPVIISLDATDPRRKHKEDPEFK